MAESLATNGAFSSKIVGLQLFWDSTAYSAFDRCPKYYEYSILLGLSPRTPKIDLEFGILVHSGVERYYHGRAKGQSHDEALRATIKVAMVETWDSKLGRPSLAPDPNKNRTSLIRLLVWYLDKWNRGKADPLATAILANGKAAVELSFQFDTGLRTTDGEMISLCGHIDRMGQMNENTYPADVKTTKSELGPRYWSQWSPDNQFTIYVLGTRIIWNMPTTGLVVDGIQVGANFIRNERRLIERSAETCEEWFEDFSAKVRQAEIYAREAHWPRNRTACSMYGGCTFRDICSRSPKTRDTWLASEFEQKDSWDPTRKRELYI